MRSSARPRTSAGTLVPERTHSSTGTLRGYSRSGGRRTVESAVSSDPRRPDDGCQCVCSDQPQSRYRGFRGAFSRPSGRGGWRRHCRRRRGRSFRRIRGGVLAVERVRFPSAAGSLVSRLPMEGHYPVSDRGRAQRRWMPRRCLGLSPRTGDRASMAGLPRNVYRRGVQWWASTCTADRANHHLGSDGSSTVVGHAVVGEASATCFWAFE